MSEQLSRLTCSYVVQNGQWDYPQSCQWCEFQEVIVCKSGNNSASYGLIVHGTLRDVILFSQMIPCKVGFPCLEHLFH